MESRRPVSLGAMKSTSERQGSLPSRFACWRRKWKRVEGFGARVVAVELDVVADGVGVEEAVDAAGGDELLGDDAVEELLAVGEDLPRLLAVPLVFEDARIDALQSPGVEERRPVDVLAQGGERSVFDDADAGKLRCCEILGAPLDGSAARAGLLDGDDGLLGRGVALAKGFVLGAMLGFEVCALLVAQQA